jgi:formate hydrogenlyase subunit 3/multisubunit Na+/H+ antiporter MnhD subunit
MGFGPMGVYVFFTITFRVPGRKGDPAPELISSWSDALLDFLMLMIAFTAYAMIVVGVVYLITQKNFGRSV